MRTGRGIRGDRVAAFTNGSLDIPDDSWHRYSAFTVLKNDTDLQKWQVALDLAEAADSSQPAVADPSATVTSDVSAERDHDVSHG